MTIKILHGDCIKVLQGLSAESVNCCVTSPPYWGLRNYDVAGQIGLEDSPQDWLKKMIEVFREIRRVLRNDGTIWVNLGDSYAASGSGTQGKSGQMADRAVVENRNKRIPRGSGRWGGGNNVAQGIFKPKDLMMMPARFAIALQEDGWYLRSDIIWAKPNPMPESTLDRPTKSHEHIFLLSKSERYYYDNEAIGEPLAETSIERISQPNFDNQKGGAKDYGPDSNRSARKGVENLKKRIQKPTGWAIGLDHTTIGWATEKAQGRASGKGNSKTFRGGGSYTKGQSKNNDIQVERDSHGNEKNISMTRNKRDVWTIATQPFSEAHFATFPPKLIEPCILAGCPQGGVVLDPFFGAGTTGLVADRLQRNCVGIELNNKYIDIAERRLRADGGMFLEIERK